MKIKTSILFSSGVDVSSRDMERVRVAVAELLGTLLLVAVGCASCTMALSHDTAKLSFIPALGFGLTVGKLVQVNTYILSCCIKNALY
jgi:glycerol uptake facilitator-like aquaporin